MNPLSDYKPSRQKSRTRDRGWIRARDLPRSPKADAVRPDILDRLRQHYEEDTLPRGGRGLFYDLRPLGMPGNPRGVIYTRHPQIKGKGNMQATPEYVSDLLSRMRRVWDPIPACGSYARIGWQTPDAPHPSSPGAETPNAAAARAVRACIRDLQLAGASRTTLHLEIRCEAADLSPRIARAGAAYGVHVHSGGGMDGLKPKKEAAERAAQREVRTLIGHLA